MEVENAVKISLPSRKDQSSDENETGAKKYENPLSEIEADIGMLMLNLGSLRHEMNEYKIKTDNEKKKLLLSFIEISDAFESVLKNIDPKLDSAGKQAKSWVSSFRTIYKMQQRALKTWGIVPIEVLVGEKANPYFHNIFDVVQNPDRENETIVEEVKRGYILNGKLLRMADVIVIKNNF